MQASHSSQAEELQAHLDRKCFVVLSETSSLQLYTYFTNEVKGYMQAWFHRTLLVPELNISAARKWAQCFLCRKFIFVFPPLFQRPHCEFVSTSSSDVFIQNKLPDSLFRKSPWQKRKSCIALFNDEISRSDQTTPNSFYATENESNFPHFKHQISQG